MEEYRIPQQRVHARLRLEDGQELEGYLYTRLHGESGAVAQLLERLADDAERFLVLTVDEERAVMVQKSAIVTLEPSRAAHAALEELQYHYRVSFSLRGGFGLEGSMTSSMPPDRSRLVDSLNGALPFLTVWAGGRAVLVNRDHVLAVQSSDTVT